MLEYCDVRAVFRALTTINKSGLLRFWVDFFQYVVTFQVKATYVESETKKNYPPFSAPPCSSVLLPQQSGRCISMIEIFQRKTLVYSVKSSRRPVRFLLYVQYNFYQTSNRAIFLLLDVQQNFQGSRHCLLDVQQRLFFCYQTSSRKNSTRRSLELFWQTSTKTDNLVHDLVDNHRTTNFHFHEPLVSVVVKIE